MSWSKRKICLIGGTGRSGTTILKQVFARHPDVASIPGRELRFPIDPDGLIDFCRGFENNRSPFLWDVRVKRLEKMLKQVARNNPLINLYSYLVKKYLQRHSPITLTPRYSGLNGSRFSPNMSRLIDDFISKLSEYRYQGYWVGASLFEPTTMYLDRKSVEEVYQAAGDFWVSVIDDICDEQSDKVGYVEDNTFVILFFDSVLKLIENARLVHIYRDPRDVVASYMNMSWTPKNVEQAAYWYKQAINEWFDLRGRLDPSTYREVSLESLVAEPEEVLRSICGFFQLEWSDRLLLTSLSGSNSGRWLSEFGEDDQEILNRILQPEIHRLGYQ